LTSSYFPLNLRHLDIFAEILKMADARKNKKVQGSGKRGRQSGFDAKKPRASDSKKSEGRSVGKPYSGEREEDKKRGGFH